MNCTIISNQNIYFTNEIYRNIFDPEIYDNTILSTRRPLYQHKYCHSYPLIIILNIAEFQVFINYKNNTYQIQLHMWNISINILLVILCLQHIIKPNRYYLLLAMGVLLVISMEDTRWIEGEFRLPIHQ